MLDASWAARWLVPAAAFLVAAVGCEGSEDEKASGIDVVLVSAGGALGEATTSAAFLCIKSVEIVPCDGEPSAGRRESFFMMRSAWAHDETTPTHLGVPALDDLARAKETTLGTLEAPSEAYCKVRVRFGPADADALGMPADRSAFARTLWIAGRASAGGADFTLTTSELRTAELPLDRFRPGKGATRATLRISRASGDVLAGVDLSQAAASEASVTVLDRLVGATRVEVR